MNARALWILTLAGLVISSCATSDLSVSALAQQGMHDELTHGIQARLDNGEAVSSFQLLLLGSAYYEMRQYRSVLATADAMAKRIAEGDNTSYGSDLSVYPQLFRASVALDLGAYEDTIKLASEARDRLRPSSSFYRHQVIQTNNLLGVANAFLGRPDEARNNLRAIREVNLTLSNLGPEKFVAMARIHMALKEFDRALESISDPGSNTSIVLTLFYDPTFQNLPKFFLRSKSLFETHRLREAKEGYDQLLKHPQITQYGGIYWLSLYDRGRIALQEGDTSTAIELLKKALEVIEQQRSSIDSESGRIGFVGDKQAVYQLLVSLLVVKGESVSAFEYVERSKARALVDMLAKKRDFSIPGGSADRVRDLLAAVDSAEISARALESASDENKAKRSFVTARRQELSQAAPELSSLVTVNAAKASTIQALLPADETLIEYFYSGEDLYAFVVTRDSLSAARLDVRKLDSDVAGFRQAIQEPGSNRWKEPARRLYARLIAPIKEKLRTLKLLVIPHGILHYLPFNALHDGNQFLVENYSIRLLPAATVLEFLKAKPADKPGMLLAFGNPDLGDKRFDLAFAQREAEDVAKTMRNSRVLMRREATKTAFRKYSSDFQILHVASHGDFDAEKPLTSSLLLAPDGPDDGRLTVSDLYSMRVDADLVTLSACETGLGKVANGDDVVGLTRGFLYAGTRTIVASLWQVDDRATNELMTAFYQSLSKGVDKRQALRSAQTDFLRRQPHPFFWAAFQLTGNP